MPKFPLPITKAALVHDLAVAGTTFVVSLGATLSTSQAVGVDVLEAAAVAAAGAAVKALLRALAPGVAPK